MFRLLLLLCLLLAHPLLATDKEQEPQRAILILDASGSMWGKIGGKAKIEIAREVVRDLLENWNPDLHLGLLTYGHRKRGDCNDIELLIPPGKVDKAAFLKAVNELMPKGKTPLTDAVLQAAEVLRSGESKATVILVSDGLETCGKDPCEAAKKLKEGGFDFTAHVVGFDLSASDQKSIRCLADTTGGLFLAAHDAPSLKSALETAVQHTIEPSTPAPTPAPTPEPTPTPAPKVEMSKVTFRTFLTEGGEQVESFYRIESLEDEDAKEIAGSRSTFELKPGTYAVKATWQRAVINTQVEIPEEATHKVDLVYNAGQLKATTSFTEGGEKGEAFYRIYQTKNALGDREEITASSSGHFGLPAGKYVIAATIGQARVEQEVEVKGGETTEVTLNIGAGVLEVSSVIGEEAISDVFLRVLKPGGLSGEPKEITASSSGKFTLPAGKYIVRGTWGGVRGEQEVEIKAGERTAVTLKLSGGLLAIKVLDASGAEVSPYMRITQSGTALSEVRKEVAAGSSKTHRLPPGKYRLESKIGDQNASADFEIKEGERTEVTLKP